MMDLEQIYKKGIFQIMKVTAVIAECNPFHEGHAYILEQARKQTGCDALIVVLSGDFVQRGAPAILPKELRVRDVLNAGADVVLELPLYYACGAADYFARGAITLLHKLGVVSDVCFGSETGNLTYMEAAARFYSNETPAFQDKLQDLMRQGLTYPEARTQAALCCGVILPKGSNDILGTEYIAAANAIGANFTFHAIPRIDVPSASDHRSEMLEAQADGSAANTIPFMSCGALSSALLYRLRKESLAANSVSFYTGPFDTSSVLEDYLDVNVDLANRIMNLLPQFVSYEQFIDLVKTRNLTYTRVSRALLHILLDVKKENMMEYARIGLIGYARVLGFREGTPVLREIRDYTSVPLITKLADAGSKLRPPFQRMLHEDLSASEFYDMISRTLQPQLTGTFDADVTPIAEATKQLIILR